MFKWQNYTGQSQVQSAPLRGTKMVAQLSGVLGLHMHIKNVGLIYLVVVTINSLIIAEVVSGWVKQE